MYPKRCCVFHYSHECLFKIIHTQTNGISIQNLCVLMFINIPIHLTKNETVADTELGIRFVSSAKMHWTHPHRGVPSAKKHWTQASPINQHVQCHWPSQLFVNSSNEILMEKRKWKKGYKITRLLSLLYKLVADPHNMQVLIFLPE